MAGDNIEAVTALLVDTEKAHGVYETAELNGVYDTDWARWYAAYAVDHGLGEILGRAVTADEVAALLAGSFADFRRLEPAGDTWASYSARRLAADL